MTAHHPCKIAVLFTSIASLIIAAGCGVGGATAPAPDPLALWKAQAEPFIVFASNADSPAGELYIYEKNGAVRRLTNNNRHESNPALSFDGGAIAYHAGDVSDPATWEIYKMDLATGEETRLTNNSVADGHPDWSPGGGKIIYASFRDTTGSPAANADIYVINSDGTGEAPLITSPWDDNDPEFSPDGGKIVFKSNRITQINGRSEIFVADSAGNNPARLTVTTGWRSDHDPSWNPAGDKIVFSRFQGTRPWFDLADLATFQAHWDQLTPWNIYTVNLLGNESKLTDVAYIAEFPVYSGDGSKIIYVDFDFIFAGGVLMGVDHHIKLMNSDGSGQTILIPDEAVTLRLEYLDW